MRPQVQSPVPQNQKNTQIICLLDMMAHTCIPETQEAEVGESLSKTIPGQKHEILCGEKKKLKAKGLGVWLK
jgi:hypothetical protein